MTGFRVGVLVWCVAMVGCQSGEVKPAAVAPKATVPSPDEFGAWPAATQVPLSVTQELWTLCRAATPTDIEAMRTRMRAKHGPHADYLVVVRVAPDSMDTFKSGGAMPLGSIVIKEKYVDPDPAGMPNEGSLGPLAEYAWMAKRPGGWEDGYADASGKPVVGELAQCASCHAQAKASDYLFRGYLNGR